MNIKSIEIYTVYKKLNNQQFRDEQRTYFFEIYNSKLSKWGLKVLSLVGHRSTLGKDADCNHDGLVRGTGGVAPWQDAQSFGVGL